MDEKVSDYREYNFAVAVTSVSPDFGLEGQRAYCRAMSALCH
jgi:hypothetical protein